jgi:hypothetical protein
MIGLAWKPENYFFGSGPAICEKHTWLLAIAKAGVLSYLGEKSE